MSKSLYLFVCEICREEYRAGGCWRCKEGMQHKHICPDCPKPLNTYEKQERVDKQ